MASTLSTVKEWAGSNASIASITGSMQNMLDPSKMMSMQEDARTHKISAEIMKHSLYKSVAGPSRRRFRSRMAYSQTWSDDPNSLNQSNSWYPRYYMSLPQTPVESGRTSPVSSPTRKFPNRFFSRGTTPRCSSPIQIVEEDEESQGLASILKPRPRFIRANQKSQSDLSQMNDVAG
ncbi:hypothetical protein HELRODRAFT_168308 [Helobdella robusta]|uniref:Uncharacterized protein n=1 Tax=Helobdella robusta TaxID=6412 RepID=T1F0F2_HELRO|nr:hypothetical protein HELRODRAFT_168308 [Helobdella robusta]ESO09337.1 hypothetical protein HELRODRAFT_168308 [Helobdella robusta]